MSYVLASDIGCEKPLNPWSYYVDGPNTQFLHPQSIATFGKTANVSSGTLSEVMQAFFADQVSRGGWQTQNTILYHRLYSQSYPGNFLPCSMTASYHTTGSATLENHNMGQIYLNNALAWTFLKWKDSDLALEPIERHNPSSYLVPVFTNPFAIPIGLRNVSHIAAANGKYTKMLQLAVAQALASNSGLGCCGKTLIFICNALERVKPAILGGNSVLAKWWRLYKSRR